MEVNKIANARSSNGDEGDVDLSVSQGMAEDYRSNLQKEGYDGIVYRNDVEGGTSYVIFEGTQAKSATGNRGTYDPKDPNIKNYSSSQPRGSDGRFGSGGGGGGGTTKDAKRQGLAKISHKPATVKKQRLAEAEQAILAKALGGQNTDDNEAFDVIVGQNAVEVKTLIDNSNDKITMHPSSLLRKKKYARSHKLKAHTVVIDARSIRRKYYYRDAVGSFRITAMERVSKSELKRKLSV